MRLELLLQRAKPPAHATPLLFVHGACCGAWCWAEHFLPYVAAHGYDAYALSLRGHGSSDGRRQLAWASIADYVADVKQVTSGLPYEPVLIGHSMGGFVLQHYLARTRAPAAVLMASAPHRGLSWRLLPGLLQHNPGRPWRALLRGNGASKEAWAELIPYLFAADLPDERLQEYLRLAQGESLRALLDMLAGSLPRPGWVTTPILVLAAEADRLLTPAEMYGLAHAYRADLEVVSGVAHLMMLDVDWRAAADRILVWLDKRGIP